MLRCCVSRCDQPAQEYCSDCLDLLAREPKVMLAQIFHGHERTGLVKDCSWSALTMQDRNPDHCPTCRCVDRSHLSFFDCCDLHIEENR